MNIWVKAATGFTILVLSAYASAGAQQKDSADARRSATRAQAMFEMVRRQHLPLSYSGPRGGECDARIGRFCQWNSSDDTVEAKQPRVIRRARETVIASLDSAALRAPRDGWITGQRVRYLLEARNDSAALRVARECAGEEWWCAALEGLALHESALGAQADGAFARALQTMPADERCRWTDMSPILEPRVRKQLGKVGCGKNESAEARLWWLADPFWSVEGNDRRAEHYARHTMAKILEPTRTAFNLSWSNDMREMIVRYGWARYWTRGPGTAFEPDKGAVSGHEATPNYHFMPGSLTADSAFRVEYDLDLAASAERYAPVVARRVAELNPQVAVFRRGDSALVVAAYDVRRLNEFDSGDVAATAVFAENEMAAPQMSRTRGRRGAMSVTVATRPQVMSVEVLTSAYDGRAAWSRKPLAISSLEAGAVAVSDPLMFEVPSDDVVDLDGAMKNALGSEIVPHGKVGIYWETYGLAKSDSAQSVSLTLARVGKSAFRRIRESIRLADKTNPLTIRWNQFPSSESVSARTVVLDLTLVPRGRYLLRIEASGGGAYSEREIDLR